VDVGFGHAVRAAEVLDEGLHVAHRGGEARAVAALPGRAAVAARVPGEEIEIGQVELVDQVRHARTVLVAAVEQNDRAAPRTAARRGPVPVEQRLAVVRAELVFGQRPVRDGERCRVGKRFGH
jgi:hypothetical protein